MQTHVAALWITGVSRNAVAFLVDVWHQQSLSPWGEDKGRYLQTHHCHTGVARLSVPVKQVQAA